MDKATAQSIRSNLKLSMAVFDKAYCFATGKPEQHFPDAEVALLQCTALLANSAIDQIMPYIRELDSSKKEVTNASD